MSGTKAAVPAAPLVVIAVGNRSRGDDAIGPVLVDRLAESLARGQRDGTAKIELIEDFQLQVEHALDLVGRELALFIDAGAATAAPYTFAEVEAQSVTASHSTHALAPSQVLGCYRQVAGDAPPPAFVLCVRGERFELGAALSESARSNVDAAYAALRALCAHADVDRWRELATP